MKIDCPWSTPGIVVPTIFSVDVAGLDDIQRPIEDTVKIYWPSFRIERHKSLTGNPTVYYYENTYWYNECHTHGAVLNTLKKMFHIEYVGDFAKFTIYTVSGAPMNILERIIETIQRRQSSAKTKPPAKLANNIAS